MKRRNFVKNTAAAGLGLSVLGLHGCKDAKKEGASEKGINNMAEMAMPFFKLSLAQV